MYDTSKYVLPTGVWMADSGDGFHDEETRRRSPPVLPKRTGKVRSSYRAARIHALLVTGFLVTGFVVALALGPAAQAQSAPPAKPGAAADPQDALFRQMVGTWDVEQRIWTGPKAEPIKPPPAVARRRLMGDTFIEEVMEAAPGSGQEPFTRIAYFNYNRVTRRYEAISMDTRAPQMMYEKSYEDSAGKAGQERRTVKLYLEDNFVLPRWGTLSNAGFKGRKVIELEKDRQIVRLYWTPLVGENAEEFLAGEYVYTRRR